MSLIHDYALMNHYEKCDQQMHVQICNFTVLSAA